FFFSSRRRHTRSDRDWSSDVCSSDLGDELITKGALDMTTTSYIQRRSPTWRDLPIDLISRAPIARWAPIPLRLIVGYGFMEHGRSEERRVGKECGARCAVARWTERWG